MDTLMTWLSLALLGWLAGSGAGWWPTPLGFMKSMLHEVKQRRPEPDFMSDEDDDMNFMNPDDDEDEEPDDDGMEEVAGGALVRSIPQRPWGPRPLDELRADAGLDDEDEEEEELPSRQAWVAAQVRAGRRPTEIDRDGARLYGVTTRTIAEDRRKISPTTGPRR